MEIQDILKNKFYEQLNFVDKLMEKYEETVSTYNTISKELNKKKSKGEDFSNEAIESVYYSTYSVHLQQDLSSNYDILSSLYTLCVLSKIELDLEEKDRNRIEELVENSGSLFVLHRNKIVEKDPFVFDLIRKKLVEQKDEIVQRFNEQNESDLEKQIKEIEEINEVLKNNKK